MTRVKKGLVCKGFFAVFFVGLSTKAFPRVKKGDLTKKNAHTTHIRLCYVVSLFAECKEKYTRQRVSLCRVLCRIRSAKAGFFAKYFFCVIPSTA